MPIQALYREAEAILHPLSAGGNIPLRLDEKRGQLISALPRLLKANGIAFSCPPLPESSSFSALEEVNGIAVFSIQPNWYRLELERLNLLPWCEAPEEEGVRQNDPEDEHFLLSYTIRRCRRHWEGGMKGETDSLFVLRLLSGCSGIEIARRYWQLPIQTRRDSLLAGAVGRTLCRSFTKNSPLSADVRYNGG